MNQTPASASPPRTTKVLMFDVSLPWANFWYDAFNVMLFIGAFAVAVGTYGSIKMGAAKERFSNERTTALETQGDQARAALGVAQADIAKANAQIAAANESAAKANERTAELTLVIENERRDREKLMARTLPLAQMKELTAALNGKIKSVRIFVVSDDIEAMMYAGGVTSVFSPPTVVQFAQIPKISVLTDLWLFTRTMDASDAEPLLGTLLAAGVECKHMSLAVLTEVLHVTVAATDAEFTLYVGPKGPVYSQPK